LEREKVGLIRRFLSKSWLCSLEGEMIGRKQTMREIKESADMAETFPESEVLNWGEISFDTLLDWVTQQKTDGEQDVFSLDVESVKGCFERWWKRSNN
jgi:hypothetical protein